VPGSDIDRQGHVNNVAYRRWAQDAAVAHSTAVGWDALRYHKAGVSWVVRSHEIRYKRPAVLDDAITVLTWIATFRNASCERRYEITRTEDGIILAEAVTEWAFVDLESSRPKRIPTELASSFKGSSGNLLWKWGAEKIPAGEAINAKLSGDSGRFSNEDSGDFIKLQPA
jgi:acyl-CoA thioester hydrolase